MIAQTEAQRPSETETVPDVSTSPSGANPRQVAASRRNGRRSRGPVTEAGKERSRKNALQHGLFARILPRRDLPFLVDRKEYEELTGQLQEDFHPKTQMEMTLVETLAFDIMRLRHVFAMESAVMDHSRPPENETKKWKGEMDLECRGRRIEDLQADRDVLTELRKSILAGKRPVFRGEQARRLTDLLDECLQLPSREVARLRKRYEKIEPRPPAMRPEDHERFLRLDFEHLKKCEQLEKDRGPEAHGCSDVASLKEMVSGKRPIPSERVALWRETLESMILQLTKTIGLVRGFQRKLDELRDDYLLRLVGQSDQLDRLGRYETMVRRNIDRTLSQLQAIRHEPLPEINWVRSEI